MSISSWGLIFAAAVGAGLILKDERFGVIGFIFAHIVASLVFLALLTLPGVLGITDLALTNAILTQAVVIVFRAQFPFAILSSFLGSVTGRFLGGKIGVID